jgi:hypothetical protein
VFAGLAWASWQAVRMKSKAEDLMKDLAETAAAKVREKLKEDENDES